MSAPSPSRGLRARVACGRCSAAPHSRGGRAGVAARVRRRVACASSPSIRKAVREADAPKRLTVGDAATAAGVGIDEAEKALADLAARAGGALEVTTNGDIVYAYPDDFEEQLLARDSDAQNAAKREQVLELAEKAVRTAFGASLLVSLLVVYVAIAAASSSERDERRRERGGGFVFGGGFNLFDVFYYMSPRPGVRRVYDDGEGEEEMNFLESIFSFVFGDGNPNEGLQEEQWRLVGTLLKEQQGAVVAEQVAPLLLEPVDASEGEEFMLEVLCRFGGTPEYDKLSGRIVYTFQSAQVTAQLSSLESEASALTSGGEVLQEQLVQFSKAPAAQRALVVMLGLANLVGVGILGAKLGDPLVVRAMARDASGAGLLESAKALMPLLSAYAVSFFAIPFGRNALNERRNAEIEKRNAARARAASSAKGSSPSLRKGLEAASRRKAKRTLRESDVAFTSGRSVTDQLARDDAAAFDRRLRERGGASDKPPR